MPIPLARITLTALSASLLSVSGQETGHPAFVYPCLKAPAAVRVDGILKQDEWAGAIQISGFSISKTDTLIREQTAVYLLHDRENLYIGVKCCEPRMKSVVARVKDWDGPVWHDDSVEMFIDPGHTHEDYYQFIINSLGTGYDGKRTDPLWSGKWRCAAKRGRDSWTVEAAIPFASLEVPVPEPGAIWGVNACRERRAGKEHQLLNWSNVRGNFHRPELFGHLLFVGEKWDEKSADAGVISKALGPARLFVSDGYREIDANGKATHVTYRSLLKAKIETVPDVAALKEEFGGEGSELLLMRFQPIEDQVNRIKRLIAGSRPVVAEDRAVSTAIIDGLAGQLGDMYWRIKLDLLLKEM